MLSNIFKSTCIYPLFGSKEYVVSEWVVDKVVIIVVVGSVAYLKPPRLCVSRVEYLNNCVYLSIFVPLCVVVVVVFCIPLNLNNSCLFLTVVYTFAGFRTLFLLVLVGRSVLLLPPLSLSPVYASKQCNDRLSASQYSRVISAVETYGAPRSKPRGF